MQSAALYQDFGTELAPAKPNSSVSRDSLEDEKLQAFENGYQAGWDDSIKAQANLDLSISSALAANLHDIETTHPEG
ncbi:MAG: ABC transporter ATP-binding protein, partial [Pseudomonadota bacterium]